MLRNSHNDIIFQKHHEMHILQFSWTKYLRVDVSEQMAACGVLNTHKRTCAFHNVVQHIYFLLGVHNESFHFKFQTGAIVNFMQSRIRNWFFYIYKTTLYFWWIWKEGRLTTFACLKHVKWFVIVIGNYALPFVATFTWTIFCQYRIHFKILRE